MYSSKFATVDIYKGKIYVKVNRLNGICEMDK